MKMVSKFGKNQNGQSAVEFALILPILILLILGMIEYGWLLNAKITLTSAAREGARAAAVAVVDKEAKALIAINNSISGTSGIKPITSIDWDYDEDNDDLVDIHNVIINISGKVKPIIGLYVSDPVIVEATAIMRLE